METMLNADFTERVVIDTNRLAWVTSPAAGVERRMLDRIGGEVARATSIVRYAADSRFPAHRHDQGEEFLVLEGVFSDEFGDYPAGTYIRNQPGSAHAPRTAPGCVIFVKLRQMAATDSVRVVSKPDDGAWQDFDAQGGRRKLLHAAPDASEVVALEQLPPGYEGPDLLCPRGEEILVLEGELQDDHGRYEAGAWIRNPAGFRRRLRSRAGARYWVKRGHIAPTP
jgi:anti-sigma factor ChrR (cupin superfamily)